MFIWLKVQSEDDYYFVWENTAASRTVSGTANFKLKMRTYDLSNPIGSNSVSKIFCWFIGWWIMFMQRISLCLFIQKFHDFNWNTFEIKELFLHIVNFNLFVLLLLILCKEFPCSLLDFTSSSTYQKFMISIEIFRNQNGSKQKKKNLICLCYCWFFGWFDWWISQTLAPERVVLWSSLRDQMRWW